MSISSLYYKQSVIILDTSNSLNLTSGAFYVYGGIGIHKDIYVGGINYMQNTTDSTNTSTGAVIVSGGMGIAKNLNIGGALGVPNITTSNLKVEENTTLGNLQVTGASIFEGSMTTGSIFVSGSSLRVPVGDTSERPTGQNGYIRYNTENSQFEGFGPGNSWGSLGGVSDADQTTKITAELSPGSNDDNLRFYTDSNIRMLVSSSGNIGIGTTTPTSLLQVNGIVTSNGITTGMLYVTGSSVIDQAITAGGLAIVSTEGSKILYGAVNMTPNPGDLPAETMWTTGNTENTIGQLITGFSFSNSVVQAFNSYVTVIVKRSEGGDLYANYEIKGLQQSSNWVINSTFIGDNSGVAFYINNSGQLGLISNIPNGTSITVCFRASTTNKVVFV